MKTWFADTFYFLALLTREDESHHRAVAILKDLRNEIVTTAWVLTEVADGLALARNRAGFGRLLQVLQNNSWVTIRSADQALFDEGVRLYVTRPDKDWSLTDCISFVVMQERGMTEALTGDHHFEQAGFVALLK
jgi:uncharacterized protein